MKLITILATVALVGCTAVPVKRNFPQAPEMLQQDCPALQTVPVGTTKLSEVVSVVSTNYAQYHECSIKVESWRDWYNTQKKIFEQAN